MSTISLHHLPSLHFVFLWNNTIVVVTSASLLCPSQWDGLIICLFACLLACLLTLPLDTAILFTEEILESSSHLGMCLAYYNSSSRGTYIHIRTPRTMALPMRNSLNSHSIVTQQSVNSQSYKAPRLSFLTHRLALIDLNSMSTNHLGT